MFGIDVFVCMYVCVHCIYCHGNCATRTLVKEITDSEVEEVVDSVSDEDDTQH